MLDAKLGVEATLDDREIIMPGDASEKLHDLEPASPPRAFHSRRTSRHRRPDLYCVDIEPLEVRARDSDDPEHRRVDENRTAEDRLVATKARTPVVIAQHRNGCRAAIDILLRRKESSTIRRYSRKGEETSRRVRDSGWDVRCSARSVGLEIVALDVAQTLSSALERGVVGRREFLADVLESAEPRAVRQQPSHVLWTRQPGRRLEKDAVHHGEHCCVHADAERERRDKCRGEPGRSRETANGVGDIVAKRLEQARHRSSANRQVVWRASTPARTRRGPSVAPN